MGLRTTGRMRARPRTIALVMTGMALLRRWQGTLRAGQFARHFSPGETTVCATDSFTTRAPAGVRDGSAGWNSPTTRSRPPSPTRQFNCHAERQRLSQPGGTERLPSTSLGQHPILQRLAINNRMRSVWQADSVFARIRGVIFLNISVDRFGAVW